MTGGRLIRKGMPLEEYAHVLAEVIVGGIVEPSPDPHCGHRTKTL